MTIPPIPPIDAASALTRSAVGDVGVHAMGQGVAQPDLAQKFQQLMQRPHEPGSVSSPSGKPGENAISHLIENEQNRFSESDRLMQDFMEHSNDMDPIQTSLASAKMIGQLSQVHVRISMAEGVSKTSNKSLESLLKNQ